MDIDTSFFTGNYPPSASLEACFVADGDPSDATVWTEILPAVELKGNSHHYHEIAFDKPVSHLRFNIYPDGGVARLRVHGIPYRDWSSSRPQRAGRPGGRPQWRPRTGLLGRALRAHEQHPQPEPRREHG